MPNAEIMQYMKAKCKPRQTNTGGRLETHMNQEGKTGLEMKVMEKEQERKENNLEEIQKL